MSDLEQPKSRRARKKDKTRKLIQTCAIELFLEKGFEAVTIAEISNKADVDPTTFWRHFRSKEATLFSDQGEWAQEFHQAFEASSQESSLLLRSMQALHAASLSVDADFDQKRSQLVGRSPSAAIESAILAYEGFVRNELTKAIAQHLGVDPEMDPRPFGVAATIFAAAGWLRHKLAKPGKGTLDPDHFKALETAVRQIAELLR